MISGILVFIGLYFGFFLTFWIVAPVVLFFERIIQWRGKSADEWGDLGVYSPGERLTSVSFIFGVLHQTISEGFLYYICILILKKINIYPSVIPVAIYAFFSLMNTVQRISRFNGSTGQPKEIGYFIGTIFAFLLFLLIR